MAPEVHRPLLLPQNRKLRHLRGIYLRNLTFGRPRGSTADDSAINKSPSKLAALQDGARLHHSLSSETLRPPAGRRRSTNLSNASPITRQKQLEYMADSKVADAFFSLHSEGYGEPLYISEVAEKATNFNFRFFELSQLGSSVTRSSELTVKIWVKRYQGQQDWSLLIEQDVDLRFLNFLGSLQNTHFPPNCLVFHLLDGVYTLELPNKPVLPKHGEQLPTSSYNALMRLATLDTSIQDALAVQEGLTTQINKLIADEKPNALPEAEDKAQLAKRYMLQQQRAAKAAQKRCDDLRTSIKARRQAIADGQTAQVRSERDVQNALEKLAASKDEQEKTAENIHGQRRRICEDLTAIFNICPVPLGPPLSFQICDIPLPNSTYDTTLTNAGEDSLSAALGHVALLTDHLQYYLGVPLPYPITPFGSRSSIRDDISILADPQREFPLYIPRGGSSAQFRFDYGWFLLNKDIEALCNAQGLKVVDIRDTLPNLKYLLYVCSAGTDEVPERKRGGVRGLWAGRMKGRGVSVADDTSSVGGSRRGSADSELLSRQREELRRAIGRTGSLERRLSPTGLPFDENETKLTLRTKGLRENVVK
ncbi:putative uv radiation resistance protein [Phaeoacremonium minimum UCRPA7]|uniref:Autophagy-related protein 14 n=1 Tax=Phaeoacremonium minimum (strain UCR-PA7) TaxID=1286976 RepID=R8B9C1_PHAM7|nr:putative uv radiation resistance protein [Phaeoacremonium minimum UCRPA7]EON95899.1 putative uv radiation resistance protein [Phaeoacremonium minimum UCRPA7]